MALEKTILLNNGIEIKNCYIRVDNITISSKTKLDIVASFYFDKDKTPVKQDCYFCKYELTEKNPIQQAYLHLKTLTEFANAQDC